MRLRLMKRNTFEALNIDRLRWTTILKDPNSIDLQNSRHFTRAGERKSKRF